MINLLSIKISQSEDSDISTGSSNINIRVSAQIPYSPIEENEKN